MKLRIPTLKPLLLALLVSLLPLSNANAAGVYGTGVSSCSEWTAEHTPSVALRGMIQHTWVLGFITAAGYYGPDLEKTNGYIVDAWMNNYCKEHPLKHIDEAAYMLVEELKK